MAPNQYRFYRIEGGATFTQPSDRTELTTWFSSDVVTNQGNQLRVGGTDSRGSTIGTVNIPTSGSPAALRRRNILLRPGMTLRSTRTDRQVVMSTIEVDPKYWSIIWMPANGSYTMTKDSIVKDIQHLNTAIHMGSAGNGNAADRSVLTNSSYGQLNELFIPSGETIRGDSRSSASQGALITLYHPS